MASRFFGAGSASSEGDSSSDEEEQQQQPQQLRAPVAGRTFQLSDEEEDTKRVVRSAKDKRFEEMETIIKHVRNHKKIKDMTKLLESFETLTKAYKKASSVIDKEGIPRFYIKCLTELEEFINECWEDRDGRKAMSKNNSKSLSSMRQRVRKYNRDFEEAITAYKENPDTAEAAEEAERSDDEESDDDEDGVKMKKEGGAKEFLKSRDGDADSSDDDSWGSSEASSSSLSSDDEAYAGNMAAKFLKKTGADAEREQEKKDRRRREKKERAMREEEDDQENEGGWTMVKQGAPLVKERPKMFAKDAEVTVENVIKKLHEILAARGKKGTDRMEQIELLVELMNIADAHNLGFGVKTKILFNVTMSVYDYNPNVVSCMKPDMWQKLLDLIQEFLQLLSDNPKMTINENISDDSEEFTSEEGEYRIRGCIISMVERMDEEFTKMLQACDAHSTEYVDRLKDEKVVCTIIRKLHTYMEGRSSAPDMCRVYMVRVNHMYYKFDYSTIRKVDDASTAKSQAKKATEQTGEQKEVPKEEPKKEEPKKEEPKKEEPKKEEPKKEEPKKEEPKKEEPTKEEPKKEEPKKEELTKEEPTTKEELTTKDDTTNEEQAKEEAKPAEENDVDSGEESKIAEDTEQEEVLQDPSALMDELCKFIYAKDVTDRIRTRAILCHIYHHAMHDRWFEARDLMLMSHLQDTIQHSDIPIQILYNRTMVQLGLCAFRHGSIRDAHNCLLDIQSGGRAKELLAQGLLMQRQQERRPEQEKIEKQRQMPFHQHINLELLECVYLVSAMLLEIPYMAAHEFDPRRRMISKSFHHQLKIADRQTLTGPPESMREHVVAASKAMKVGDWLRCKNFILSEKMDTKVWNLFPEKDKVREMIQHKIQEESLRTYLFTYSSVYNSLSLATLAEQFQMERSLVHSIISKMIINEELMASMDEPTQSVVMHRTEPSRLQSLALQLSEKIATLVENNEKLLEIKQGQMPGYQRRDGNYQRGGGGYGQNKWQDQGSYGGGGGGRRQGGYGGRGGHDRDYSRRN